MQRRRLSETRVAVVHKFYVGGCKGYIRVGLFENGDPGEVFINMDHSTDSGTWGCIAIFWSMALQQGIPLRTIVRKLSFTRFPPQGVTKNPELPMAFSVMDYLVRWMWLRFGDGTNFMEEAPALTEEKVASDKGGA